MHFGKAILTATLLAALPVAANAQDAGTVVYGNDDAPIGTVVSNADGIATIDTGTYEVPVPANLLAQREIGWTANVTKDQLNGMMAARQAEAEAKLAAALVEGTEVVTADGVASGMIQLVDTEADQYVIKRDDGIITLTREQFMVGEDGKLTARLYESDMVANVTAVPEDAVIQTAGSDGEDTTGK